MLSAKLIKSMPLGQRTSSYQMPEDDQQDLVGQCRQRSCQSIAEREVYDC